MMFSLRWEQTALDELTNAWLSGSSEVREAITVSAARIEVKLLHDPLANSESRENDTRILIDTPLAITFRIEVDGTTVSVLHAWLIRKRG